MSTISIDYDKAYAEANRLQSIANDCESAVSRSKRLLAGVPSYWRGAAADEFISRREAWNRETQEIQNELLAISHQIRAVTDAIKEADRRAAEAIRRQQEAAAAEAVRRQQEVAAAEEKSRNDAAAAARDIGHAVSDFINGLFRRG